MQKEMYGEIFSAIYSKVSQCLSIVYFSVSNIGSYRHEIRSFPTILESLINVSILSSISGTFGSISFPYAVIV